MIVDIQSTTQVGPLVFAAGTAGGVPVTAIINVAQIDGLSASKAQSVIASALVANMPSTATPIGLTGTVTK